MTKHEFLQELEKCLAPLSEEERVRQIANYSELLDDMSEDGMSEAEAVARLGNPEAAAQEIICQMSLPVLIKPKIRPKRGWSALTVILAVLASPVWLPILLALLAAAAAVYVAIGAVIASLFAVVLALGAAGIAGVVLAGFCVLSDFPAALLGLGAGIFCAGVTIFLFLGTWFVTKNVGKGTGWMMRKIKVALFSKGGKG